MYLALGPDAEPVTRTIVARAARLILTRIEAWRSEGVDARELAVFIDEHERDATPQVIVAPRSTMASALTMHRSDLGARLRRRQGDDSFWLIARLADDFDVTVCRIERR